MNTPNYRRTKYSCYFSYLSVSSVFMLPPILFLTFHESYNISYTLLGTLVLVNFLTQLSVDLIFSAFSRYFNVKLIIKIMPLICSLGLFVYAIVPMLYPSYAYIGLLIGTFIFSLSSGLGEVFLSPTVAALPSDNPERDMTTLHSLYAYGSLIVIVASTLFLYFIGEKYWPYLTMIFALLPLVSFYLFSTSYIPDFNRDNQQESSKIKNYKFGFLLTLLCIFFGSVAENTMTSWISSYVENVFEISKALGDILGMAAFAIMLCLGRTFYAKYGKNITRVLLYGMIGATVCYFVAALSPFSVVSIIACALTGLATSLLWPGSLILMEEKFPGAGVGAYALMAAGGDLGASLGPQLMGALVDIVSNSGLALKLTSELSISTEQLGMRVALLALSVFPLLGTIVIISIIRYFKKRKI